RCVTVTTSTDSFARGTEVLHRAAPTSTGPEGALAGDGPAGGGSTPSRRMCFHRRCPTDKEVAVASYVVLLNWTDKGIRAAKDTVARSDAAAEMIEQLGGKLKEVYWTLGAHDIIAILEAPDDETATAFALASSSQGNVRTTTLRAFDREEVGR